MKTIIVPVDTFSEFYDNCGHAVIELSDEALNRINELRRAVKEYGLAMAVVHDATPVMFDSHPDEEDDPHHPGRIALVEPEADRGRTECSKLFVEEDKFFYAGLWKHTDVRWETKGIYFEQFDNSDFIDLREESLLEVLLAEDWPVHLC